MTYGGDAQRAIDAVWRIESPRLIASLARAVGDVALAEDLVQEALVAALRQWPTSGVPDNPAAWLTTTAKRRAIDEFRKRRVQERVAAGLASEIEEIDEMPEVDEDVGDEMLRLVFIACHPILSREAQVALTLKMVAGLTTDEIAKAFLVTTPTMSQRILRAKRTLGDARIPFEMPASSERSSRLASVLEVVYLIFNEGYAASAGERWTRSELCEEALRLGRVLAELVPSESEAHGLVALMEIQASRLRARVGRDGEALRLEDQDRARWDRLLIQRGLASLERAYRLGPPGPYTLQAAIAACHARARSLEETDWMRIMHLYDALLEILPSPIVELNRAVVLSKVASPAAALEVVDRLARDESSVSSYRLLPAVRADLLAQLGRVDEARLEFERAAGLAGNERERDLLLARSKATGGSPESTTRA